MFNEYFADPTFVTAISMFSLAWFLVGLAAGKRLAAGPRTVFTKTGAQQTKNEKMEVYVGNLPYDLRSKDLRRTFEDYGKVQTIRVIENKFTGKSKGFAFVEMANHSDALSAIKALNGKELSGRKLVVNESRTRPKE